MEQKRCFDTVIREIVALLSSNPATLHRPLKVPPSLPNQISAKALLISRSYLISSNADSTWCSSWPHHHPRHFSSNYRDESENDEEDEETVGEDSDGQEATSSDLRREYSADEKEEEAAAIVCKVIGPLQKSDRVFKPYEPVFVVVQIGSHQLKVSNGDCIFTERLKFCEVNDKELTKLRITDIQGIAKPEMKVVKQQGKVAVAA
ncbi:hypothetical protein GH714_002300 [Hevea brasiliensis]|uniref:Large ribosomal subunit protein bL21m n=1 Tax=Hevea brasiliensis TaxID=3981 RepID=A0A6A6L9N6_HEVBR|nr:hypothetical protein GH714_002300 [Hevea brasiliensis]